MAHSIFLIDSIPSSYQLGRKAWGTDERPETYLLKKRDMRAKAQSRLWRVRPLRISACSFGWTRERVGRKCLRSRQSGFEGIIPLLSCRLFLPQVESPLRFVTPSMEAMRPGSTSRNVRELHKSSFSRKPHQNISQSHTVFLMATSKSGTIQAWACCFRKW